MAEAVSNGKIQPKRTKAMDLRFHWLRDRECQKQFRIYWRPGKLNYADYWTKHHAALHHQNVRKDCFDAAHCTRDATSRTIAIGNIGCIKLSSYRALARV